MQTIVYEWIIKPTVLLRKCPLYSLYTNAVHGLNDTIVKNITSETFADRYHERGNKLKNSTPLSINNDFGLTSIF